MKKRVELKESEFHEVVTESVKCVLEEVYPKTNNKTKPISLNETNARRLITRHIKSGFAIVSACRSYTDFNLDKNNPDDRRRFGEINANRTRSMVELIQNNGFSYTLTYGGFIENIGTEDEENVYERSVIIYAEKRSGEVDEVGMYNLALEICNDFNQDSVLIKMPNDNPKYVRKDGSIDMEFRGDISFNDLSRICFTDLHKNTEEKITPNSKPTRFSFTESYIAPIPQCYSELHVRWLKGERFLMR